MSSALIAFERPKELPLDPSILAAALDALAEPMAVTENGKLIYANRSFAQCTGQSERGSAPADCAATDPIWSTSRFCVGARTFSLTTLRREPPPQSASESDVRHLEILGRLVGGVAHDFNNLLTGILLYCDLLKTKLPSTSQQRLKIEEIRRAADQGAGLIRQLMTVGREEKEAPPWVSFNHALQDLVPLLQHLLGEHITITTDLAEGSPRVGLTLAQAQQLILNLVLNARDATPAGGVIRLETRLRDCERKGPRIPGFEFTVSDSGCGMDPETAAQIFEPFYTTKVRSRGHGRGLATVKQIVDAAGGVVGVETAPGQGTRMTVRLPQVEAPKNEINNPPAKARLRRRSQRSAIQESAAHQPRNRGAQE